MLCIVLSNNNQLLLKPCVFRCTLRKEGIHNVDHFSTNSKKDMKNVANYLSFTNTTSNSADTIVMYCTSIITTTIN